MARRRLFPRLCFQRHGSSSEESRDCTGSGLTPGGFVCVKVERKGGGGGGGEFFFCLTRQESGHCHSRASVSHCGQTGGAASVTDPYGLLLLDSPPALEMCALTR